MKRRPVTGGLRIRACEVLRRAVEEGLNYGRMHAHKHTDAPDEGTIKDQILQGILREVSEYIEFGQHDRRPRHSREPATTDDRLIPSCCKFRRHRPTPQHTHARTPHSWRSPPSGRRTSSL